MIEGFLPNVAVVLTVAAVTTVACVRLKQPVILGYLAAGALIGPRGIGPTVDPGIVRTLSEVGVTLLMFAVGLEFDLRRLRRVAPTGGFVALVEVSAMGWLGWLVARALGVPPLESLFVGAIVSISSTSIIARVFEQEKVDAARRDRVFGILIAEDMLAIVLLGVATALARGSGLDLGEMARVTGRLAAFLAGLFAIGYATVPWILRGVVRLGSPETTLIAAVGVCFTLALLAEQLGYSVALGGFLAGSLVAESGCGRRIERLVHPVRDVFAAIYFVSVGAGMDPGVAAGEWRLVLALTALVLLGKTTFVSIAAFLTGAGVRGAIRAGMSLAQIGEFSFILAGIGATATGGRVYPIAVAVSGITTLLAPWMIRGSDRVARAVEEHLPPRLRRVTAQYGSWLARGREARIVARERAYLRRLLRLLALDAACLGIVIVGQALLTGDLVALLTRGVPAAAPWANLIALCAAAIVALPFVVGIVRCARALGSAVAQEAFPLAAPIGRGDPGAAPRRLVAATVELATLLAVALPLMALTQPIVGATGGAVVFAVAFAIVAANLWYEAGARPTRAGAHEIFASLARRSRDPRRVARPEGPAELGEPRVLALGPGANGRSLRDLGLRSTGVIILALLRPDEPPRIPRDDEPLEEADLLAVTGTPEAMAAAEAKLRVRQE